MVLQVSSVNHWCLTLPNRSLSRKGLFGVGLLLSEKRTSYFDCLMISKW